MNGDFLEWVGKSECELIEDECPELEDGFWGSVKIKSYSLGSVLELSCNKGYSLTLEPADCILNLENNAIWNPDKASICSSFRI
ncbi:hypothetical protein MHBO_001115 [Bonamia ostreae]|uniref:Sushi domain-containing protein n=1 Tax=Bonamia ostreae TaxID=126728 RepID=A0ABV2AHV3_9EUKA